MSKLMIMIASKSDEVFLNQGLDLLQEHDISYKLIISSTHRDPAGTAEKIKSAMGNKDLRVIISGAATATGLPGIVAGYFKCSKVLVLGVRFSKEPGPAVIEDASFNLSAMPQGVPLVYTGFNEKGFFNACQLAVKLIQN